MASTKDAGGSALERLREFGLRYPGAHTKSPWPGHLDLAVNDKTFAYLSLAGEPLTISCKLPRSADSALSLPFTTPTAYGLGKSGWVTATFPDDTPVPVELLEEWIDESYRAQAPKRLSADLPELGVDTTHIAERPRRPKPAGKERLTPVRRSTVKQRAGETATPVQAAARTPKRRPAPATEERSGPRATKRASVSQRAAKRTSKKRRA
jgi:predicted DNA-binding protein (MmcQ/YjbR family)